MEKSKNDISIIIVFPSSQVNSNSRKMSKLLFHKYSRFKANKIFIENVHIMTVFKSRENCIKASNITHVELLVLPTGGALVAFAVRTNSLVNEENVDKHATKSSVLYYGIFIDYRLSFITTNYSHPEFSPLYLINVYNK